MFDYPAPSRVFLEKTRIWSKQFTYPCNSIGDYTVDCAVILFEFHTIPELPVFPQPVHYVC